METLMYPQLYCPFPAKVNPYLESASLHTLEWSQELGLTARNPEEAAQFLKTGFTGIAAGAYPDATEEGLFLVSDYTVWLSRFLDTFYRIPLDEKATFIRDTAYTFMDIMEQRPVIWLTTGNPLIAALEDLWKRIRAASHAAWRQRFVKSMELFFDACLWQARNKRLRRTPSRQEYIQMRSSLSAMPALIDLIEVANHTCLPDLVRQHSIVTELGVLCGNVVCWANDMFSLQHDAQPDETHNLVNILEHEQRSTQEAAIQTTIGIHNKDMLLFIELEQQRPSFDSELNHSLQQFVNSLRCRIRSNLEWGLRRDRRMREKAAAVKSEA